MPPNFKFPVSEELWTPLYNEFPPIPRGQLVHRCEQRCACGHGPAQTGGDSRSGECGIYRSCSPVGARTIQRRTRISRRRRVQPLLNSFIGVQFRQTVWAMLAAVILVLLIACVNVMNMQFGRAALRAKELAIRGALGATRWRLVRQMLTESLVVAVFGAVAGSSLGLLGRRLADPRHGRAAVWVRIAVLGSIYDRRARCSRSSSG